MRLLFAFALIMAGLAVCHSSTLCADDFSADDLVPTPASPLTSYAPAPVESPTEAVPTPLDTPMDAAPTTDSPAAPSPSDAKPAHQFAPPAPSFHPPFPWYPPVPPSPPQPSYEEVSDGYPAPAHSLVPSALWCGPRFWGAGNRTAAAAGGVHLRFPYYNYRSPWTYGGPASVNHTILW